MAEQATSIGTPPRAIDTNVLKAATGGSAVASFAVACLFGIDSELHPSGGPFDFSGPKFVIFVFLIGLLVGSVASLIAVSLSIALLGGDRLKAVTPVTSVLIGALSGTLLLWIALGIGMGEWRDYKTIGFGALYGACVAGIWSRLVRR
jgi:hypothetical protein